MGARDWGKGACRVTADGRGVSFGGDENILELDRDDVCTTF